MTMARVAARSTAEYFAQNDPARKTPMRTQSRFRAPEGQTLGKVELKIAVEEDRQRGPHDQMNAENGSKNLARRAGAGVGNTGEPGAAIGRFRHARRLGHFRLFLNCPAHPSKISW